MDYSSARTKMVDNQIRTTDVTAHAVLAAFLEVPRETFVPDDKKVLAYIDNDIEVAPCRYVMEPSPLAKLIQAAEIQPGDKVLEIAAGSGYATAILAHMGAKVTGLESDAGLAETARANLAASGATAEIVTGDLEKGHAGGAPYDVIFVNGAVEVIPDGLWRQVRDGGRLVAVVGYGLAGRAKVFVVENGLVSERPLFNTSVQPLPGFRKAAEFVF